MHQDKLGYFASNSKSASKAYSFKFTLQINSMASYGAETFIMKVTN
jgi:hypothetical protein